MERQTGSRTPELMSPTVGFHNSNLRTFNLRVSNPNKLIVDVFLTRCRISMCQGLGPKKHDEISEIDRMNKPIALYCVMYSLYSSILCPAKLAPTLVSFAKDRSKTRAVPASI